MRLNPEKRIAHALNKLRTGQRLIREAERELRAVFARKKADALKTSGCEVNEMCDNRATADADNTRRSLTSPAVVAARGELTVDIITRSALTSPPP